MSYAMTIEQMSLPYRRTGEYAFVAALGAGRCAQLIAQGFFSYDEAFRELTRRAPERFQLCDWQGSQLDAAERQDLFGYHVERTVADIETRWGEQVEQPAFWQNVMQHFVTLTSGLADAEICRAFCQSVLIDLYRTMNDTVAPVLSGADGIGSTEQLALVRHFAQRGSLESLLERMLQAVPVEAEWSDLSTSTGELVQALCKDSGLLEKVGDLEGVELFEAVFYRCTRAYVIASLKGSTGQMIFALELRNDGAGVSIDDVLVGELEVGNLFRSSGTSFSVELEHPMGAVAYLHTLVPQVQPADFLTLIGRPCNARIPVANQNI